MREMDIESLALESGAHYEKATAYIAGEPWSAPQCASPVIASFLRSWNDSLGEKDRNRLLKPYITKVIGTRTTEADEETRAWMAMDWLVRVNAPAWLDLAGLKDEAARLRNLPALTSSEIALAVQDTINQARDRAYAARSAARTAAWSAAWDAAWGATWYAAWYAAWPTAGSAARYAAWYAAWYAAGATAWYAAWSTAWYAAGATAGSALRPTVETLQASACELLDRMCAVGHTGDEKT